MIAFVDGGDTRDKGTPQGSVVSPLLANLFLHYAFDKWMERHQSYIPFERYADDIICHCQSEAQAEWLRSEIAQRLAECHLGLHA
jgi:RNA-directed DNA polymerase